MPPRTTLNSTRQRGQEAGDPSSQPASPRSAVFAPVKAITNNPSGPQLGEMSGMPGMEGPGSRSSQPPFQSILSTGSRWRPPSAYPQLTQKKGIASQSTAEDWMPLPPHVAAKHAVTPRPTFASPLLYHDQLPTIPYNVHAHSSYSANYLPKHILVDKPADQGSRWSSGTNNQMQYLLLKLDKTSTVCTLAPSLLDAS